MYRARKPSTVGEDHMAQSPGRKVSAVGYMDLLRPFTLLAPIIVSLCIMIASYAYNGHTGNLGMLLWTTLLPASITMALLNAASNALNQATDVVSDSLSKPYRPIPRGIISPWAATCVSFVLYFIAILISTHVHQVFTMFTVIIAVFSVTYSLPPRMKDKLFINQLWIALPRGLLGILASWSVFGNPFQILPVTIGMIAMLFLIGGSVTKDIMDSEADKKAGTNTLVNVYGTKIAAFLAFPFMFFPFTMIPLLIQEGVLEGYFWLLTFLIIPSYLIFHFMIRDHTKSRMLENTSAWSLMYLTYFLFAFSFSLLTVVGSLWG
jgi:geranylgeranylglycerol-phosphate geranylgeranyltransferase